MQICSNYAKLFTEKYRNLKADRTTPARTYVRPRRNGMAVSRVCSRCWRVYSTGAIKGLATRGAQWREMGMFAGLPDMSSLVEKRKEFSEERILGYSPDRVYNVVADLNSYKEFLPWCQDSKYLSEGAERSYGQLSIGFPPLLERYTAMVLHNRPTAIRTISTDGSLFTSLENHWQFRPGPVMDTGPTCLVNFWVMFEFRSLLYAQLGNIVFDEVARTMAASFERRCEAVYGPSHLAKRRGYRTKLHPARTQ